MSLDVFFLQHPAHINSTTSRVLGGACKTFFPHAQAQLLYLDAADSKRDVTIYVNSPGGSVTAGMAVFDTMRHVRPDCSTVCVGLAASMGAFLLASGQKVRCQDRHMHIR